MATRKKKDPTAEAANPAAAPDEGADAPSTDAGAETGVWAPPAWGEGAAPAATTEVVATVPVPDEPTMSDATWANEPPPWEEPAWADAPDDPTDAGAAAGTGAAAGAAAGVAAGVAAGAAGGGAPPPDVTDGGGPPDDGDGSGGGGRARRSAGARLATAAVVVGLLAAAGIGMARANEQDNTSVAASTTTTTAVTTTTTEVSSTTSSSTSTTSSTTVAPTTTTVKATAATTGARTTVHRASNFGDDARLDGLANRCRDGDFAACDQLYATSAPGTQYSAYGDTCGGRDPAGTGKYCTDLHPAATTAGGIPNELG